MEETKLTEKEKDRYEIVRSCIEKDITNKDASIKLGVTIRQVQNQKRRVIADGKKGIIHASKGKPSGNKTAQTIITKITRFFTKKKHSDFGPTFTHEQLEKQGVHIPIETLRGIMIQNNLWKPHPRRGPEIVREWRERKPCHGELVQFDGSYHDWFENGTEECLLAAIDDATSTVVRGIFEDNEGVLAVFRFWKAYVEQHGCPVAVYLDKFSTYKVNHKNATDNTEFVTQFTRAMNVLGIRVICANSPEAKGRIERLFGTLQDRMVKEMRLSGVQNRKDANIFLEKTYFPDHNKRFSVPPKQSTDMHRPLTDSQKKKLSSIFSIQSPRIVHNDFTIQFKNRWFQLDGTQPIPVYKKDTVTVEERLDGSLHIKMKDIELAWSELPERPKPVHIPVPLLTPQKPAWKPPKDHPWNRRDF